ncbi:MAG: AAA family ATPase [Muribaculaceae bacterium]|nr:AAA family ATPase [Muribaculaceae bacterium]
MGENTFQTYGSQSISFKVENNDDPEGIKFTKTNGDTKTAYKERLLLLYNYYIGKNIKTVKNANYTEMKKVVGIGIDYTFYRGILQAIMDAIDEYFVSKPYIFIIDEINRGEISKIFGELFYSIDSGYRGTKGRVSTQYQNLVPDDDVFSEGFYIPENVYIIGTMNDIDRSVESMDFAMRRRFAWKEITAESRQSMLEEDETWGSSGKPSDEVIAEMIVRMNNLNACIIDKYKIDEEELSPKDRIGLTEAYQIGAAYFLKYCMYGNFDDLWTNHLKGLLYEYLRGTTNIEAKIERLQKAYNDTTVH